MSKRTPLKVKTLKAKDVEFEIECLPEDIAIEGSFASGDDAQDAATVRMIEADLASGNEWAWCCVKVTARYADFEGTDYLGGCSYKSAEDFQSPDGYYPQMCSEALADLNRSIRETVAKVAPLVECAR